MMLNAISFCSFVLASGVDRSSCIRAADEVISATPSNLQVSATTSRSYKRHLAQHLCGVSESMTALELGIYHGHTTAVLASMFKKVIAVDLKQEFLKKAADTLGKLERKVVFLEMDLFVDGWSLFAGNRVDVVVIDANHGYEYVRADAENALRYLPHLKYLVFHDTWTDEVERAVTELESAGVMSCQNIGLGADGKEYDHREWDPRTNRTWFVKQTRPEGKVCENRHTQISGKAIAPNFWEKLFLLYKQPVTTLGMCSAGFFRFEANGVLKAGVWSEGTWKMSNVSHDMLLIRLPKMSPRPMEIHFNVDRSAFLLTQMGHTHADWFGILDQMVQRPFHLADGMF